MRPRIVIGVVLSLVLGLGAFSVTSRAASAQAISSLPASVWSAVSTDAVGRTGIDGSNLVLLRFAPVTFNDGCLGLGQASESCLLAQTDGYVVWVAAGDAVLRYHTNSTGSVVRLGPDRPTRAGAMVEGLLAGVRDRVQQQDRDRIGRMVSGDAPRGGGFGLVVFGGGTTEQLRVGAACGPVLPVSAAFWATVDGEFVVYVPAAQVAAVNARWLEAFRLGIPGNTPLLMRCQ